MASFARTSFGGRVEPRVAARRKSIDGFASKYGDTEMKRTSLLVALLALTVTSTGCCCCNWLRRPAPVVACPPPACPAPACNPCATAPVTYGAPAAVAPYAPPPQW